MPYASQCRRNRVMARGWCIVGALILLRPTADCAAQRMVSGVVFDSLRSLSPVAGAEVVLLGTGLRSRTDAAGRFSFAVVPDSADGVTYWAPWLDSVGLPPLKRSLPGARAIDGFQLTLSTPSLATYQRMVCGTVLPDDAGILVGEVRDPAGRPREGALVAARWYETSVSDAGIATAVMATVDTTRASGYFTLCGVPQQTVISLRAADTELASGEHSVAMTTVVQRSDIIVASREVVTRVRGRVLTSAGVGVTDATISVLGDSARSAISDSAGRFDIEGVPRRSSDLEVRAVGYLPRAVTMHPTAASWDVGDVLLEPLPTELEAVRVTADAFEHERLEFERRRRGAAGFFITEDQLKNIPQVSANVVANLVPRLRAVSSRGAKPILKLRAGSGFCNPRFINNGIDEGVLIGERAGEQWSLLERAKRIEVYTANQAPARYNDFDGCGVVVVWTR